MNSTDAMGRAGLVRRWRGLGVNNFDLVGPTRLYWEREDIATIKIPRASSIPSPSGAPINKLASISCLPIATRPHRREAGLMRFESVTIAAGEKARCKSRPRMNSATASDRARLNGNTFTAVSLPSAAAEGAQTMRRVQRVSPLPNRAFDKSQLRQPDFRSNDSA